VYSGRLTAGSYVLNANKGKKERIGRLLEMHANSREDVKVALTGDIIALAGLKDTITGETLCDPENPIVLERMDFPDPVIKVAIEPKTKADIDKMATGLIKLAQEDPSFHFSRDEEINQTVIEGMGELHLEIIVDRLKREYKVYIWGSMCLIFNFICYLYSGSKFCHIHLLRCLGGILL